MKREIKLRFCHVYIDELKSTHDGQMIKDSMRSETCLIMVNSVEDQESE